MARDDLEAPVLDFHDVLLRRLDVDLLRDPTAWLNDQARKQDARMCARVPVLAAAAVAVGAVARRRRSLLTLNVRLQ